MLTGLFNNYLSLVEGTPVEQDSTWEGSFRDYVEAERESLTSGECRGFWQQGLAESEFGMLPRLPKSYRDAPALAVNHVLDVPLPVAVAEGLKRLSQLAAVPLKNVLLAAHLRAVSIITGQSDVVTGIVMHGRAEGQGSDQVLGLFLNTLPFRLKLRGGTWLELVQQTFEAERQIMPFRHYPLAQIQREHGGRHLFETAFNFTHFHVYQSLQAFSNVEVLSGSSHAETNYPFWASFSLDVNAAQVRLALKGEATLTAEQMNVIKDIYVNALTAMAQDPQQHYETQRLLPGVQEHRILRDWNNTAADYPHNICFHELFEKQAERMPAATAVDDERGQLTYGELNRRSSQLAHYLRSRGVGAETPVGVFLERAQETLVSMLGIMKSGGVWVPLDSEHPQERLRFVMEDAGIRIVLTREGLADRLPADDREIVRLDSDWGAIDRGGQRSARQPRLCAQG